MQAYSRMYNLLREQIVGSYYAPGQKLPPEQRLCEQFGVSRITARHALRLLAEQGLVERHQGRGTFVRAVRPKKLPILNCDFAGSIRKEAPNLKRKLLSHTQIKPPSHIAEIFGLLKAEQCLLDERLDLLDREPLAYDRAYIPLQFTNSINEEILVRVDFLEVWLEREGLNMSHIVESIEAVEADGEAVERLCVSLRSPMLLATDIVYGANGQALAVFESIYRGDRIKLISTNVKGTMNVRATH